jgi:osmotically-inducible protein OsmY
MIRINSLLSFAAAIGILAAGMAVNSAGAPAQTSPPSDNTKVNKQDRAEGAVTADQQKENRTDRDLTKQIRKAVTSDKSLSTYAHNVKIVSQDGAVTLKGPVRSDEEKQAVFAKAEQIAGTGKVADQLTVEPEKK